MSRESTRRVTRAIGFVETRRPVQFLVAFALILLLKWPTLHEPPVWDTAMGLFPAALTLSANHFDVLGLLAMPAYPGGGPNTHSLSPVTLVTAAVMTLTGAGSTESFVVLHLLHFAVAAFALVTLFAFASPVFGVSASAWLGLTTLLFPVFSTQVGYMYLEIPLFLCAVCALRAWTNQHVWQAIAWATTAFAIKETGIVVPATLAMAALLERSRAGVRSRRVALIMAPSVALHAITAFLSHLATKGAGDAAATFSRKQAMLALVHYLDRFVFNVPDLWALFLLVVVAGPMLGPGMWRVLRNEPTRAADRDPETRARLVLGYSGLLIVVFILFFTIALPLVYRFPFVLPRYSVVVAPFLILWFGYVLKRSVPAQRRGIPTAGFVLLSIWFAVNANGAFYPSDVDTEGPGNDHALTERSRAYERLLTLERQAVGALQVLPGHVPVYYGHYEHYLLNYSGLGFASVPLANGHNLYVEPLPELTREHPTPLCAYALYNYPSLGGDQIMSLIRQARNSPGLAVDVIREFRDGRYVITLWRIQKAGDTCPD